MTQEVTIALGDTNHKRVLSNGPRVIYAVRQSRRRHGPGLLCCAHRPGISWENAYRALPPDLNGSRRIKECETISAEAGATTTRRA